MPIRAELRHHYRTPQWKAARAAVKERAGDKCERCHAKNGSYMVRDRPHDMAAFVELTEKDAAGLERGLGRALRDQPVHRKGRGAGVNSQLPGVG